MTPNQTEQPIELMNEAIARFDGWEKVRVGYYGEHNKDFEWNETEWQVKNVMWMDKVGLEDIGEFYVKVNEDEFMPAEELKYHSDWSAIHKVWDKLLSCFPCLNKKIMKSFTQQEKQFYQFIKPMSRAMITGNITEAHRVLYAGITWFNKQDYNGK